MVALNRNGPSEVLLPPEFKQFPQPSTNQFTGLASLNVPPVVKLELVANPLSEYKIDESPTQIVCGVAVTGVGLMFGITLTIVASE